MKKIRVMVLTTRFGGPLNWALGFREYCKKARFPIDIRIRRSIASLLVSPFYSGSCDVVHSIQPLVFRFWKKPVVLNIRGDYRSEFNIRNVWASLYGIAIRKADKVVVPSEYLKKQLKLKDVEVIPNCICTAGFPAKNDYSIKNKVKIITVTSFAFNDKAMGVFSLVKVLIKSGLKERTQLDVFGGGRHLNEVMKKVRGMDIPENIEVSFKGKVKGINNILPKYDIFAYYSPHDNFPNSVLEAMACGLPIITNKVGAVTEMIKDGKEGLIAQNDLEYSKLLKMLMRNPRKRKEIGRNALKRTERDFSWKKNAKRWYEVYSSLLKG